MKLILGIALFIPLSTFAAKTCSDLEKYAKVLDKKINTAKFEKCDDLKAEDLGLSAEQAKLFDEYKCLPYNELDQKQKAYDHDIALLKGIDYLKKELATNSSEILSEDQKKSFVQNSNDLIKNLGLASDLERLLSTHDQKLVALISTSDNFHQFQTKCLELMGKKTTPEVCKKEMTNENFTELKSFSFIFEKSNREIKNLHKSLELSNNSGLKSYDEVIQGIKVGKDGVTDESLEIVGKLSQALSEDIYLTQNIKQNIKNLDDLGSAKKASDMSQNFQSFMNEMIKRQAWQNRGIHTAYLPNISSEQSCTQEELSEGEKCLPESAKNDASKKGIFHKAQAQMKKGLASLKDYQFIQENCSSKMTESCEQIIKNLQDKYDDIQKNSDVINAVKAHLSAANKDLIEFRNYSLEQLHVNECIGNNSEESSIDYCTEVTDAISPEVIHLALDGGKILASLEKPNSDKMDIAAACDSTRETKIPFEDELCDHFDSDGKPEEKPLISTPGPVDNSHLLPQQRSSGLGDATNNLISTLAGLFAPKQNFNPYMSGAPNFPMGTGMSLSSQVIGSHMMYGFGSYQSTPGLRPYSSINSDVGKSSAYTFGSGSYFSKPIGW